MPRKTRASSGHVAAGSPEPVDVVIITALKEEYDAVLEVETGALPGSTWQREEGPIGLEVAFRTFLGAGDRQLRVAVTRALGMGGVASVSAVTPLVDAYAPRCLAMCGVCAGRKDKVALGDVIIADRLWTYDTGSLTPENDESGRPVERVRGDITTYQLHPVWHHKAESFQPPGDSSWLAARPHSLDAQMDWVLERLSKGENPLRHPDHEVRCADWPRVLELLWDKRFLQKETLELTELGRTHIQRKLLLHRDRLPEPKPFQVHVGPIGTGSKVVRDPNIFDKLSTTMRTVLGLEMEASALGALGHLRQLDHIVMKGVMDFADPAKNDNFKHFAARASAECLLAFLREHQPTRKAGTKSGTDLQARTEAVASYKRARAKEPSLRRLDLRGLVGIPQGPHETELELLTVAVAPALYQEAVSTGSAEARLHRELVGQKLAPEEQRPHQEQLSQLADERWDYHGERHGWSKEPISFAAALRKQRFVVIGDPGSGKSVLTRLAFLACLEGKDGDRARALLGGDEPYDPAAREAIAKLRALLPIRLSLGKFGQALAEKSTPNLKAFIRDQLRALRARTALRKGLDGMLADGHVFLLCDGLDEVPEEQRKRVVDEVEGLVTRYPDVRFLLTSRPNGYWPRVPHIPHTLLAPLHYRQQRSLVLSLHHVLETALHASARDVERARLRTNSLLRAIRSEDEWFKLSSNPLLLTLSALTPTDENGVPQHRVFVFENFLQTLLGKWRFARSEAEASRLLDTWASVASKLVLKQEHHSLEEARLLELLAAASGGERKSSASEAREALRLAFETGLIRKEEKTILFWHRTFAEFLAAYALTRRRKGAAKRLLKSALLPPLVLQLAAARLGLVSPTAPAELDALAEGLLARDETGEGRLLRPGLRAVSACLGDGVLFGRPIIERVWTSWAEVLETTPPSPLWADFDQLTQDALPHPPLPSELLERFATLDDRGVHEVQDWLARLVAPAAAEVPAARKACARWLEQYGDEALRLHGAFGLASSGDWSEAVIDILGRFGARTALDPKAVGECVRRGGPPVLARLRELVRIRLPSEVATPPGGELQPELDSASAQRESRQRDLRLSATFLLAIAGAWDEDVAEVLKQALSGRPSLHREQEAKTVLRLRADDAPVQRALLEWISDGSTLGSYAREIVKEVGPIVEGIPEAVLARTAEAEGTLLTELTSVLVAIGEQRRTLTTTLRRWLADAREEHRMCAARILLRFTRSDEQLHEAIRRGMDSSDALARAHWAHLALGLTDALTTTALETLQQCARSPVQEVRGAVHGERFSLSEPLQRKWLEGRLACAEDSSVSAEARLEAVEFVAARMRGEQRLLPILHELLDATDAGVRRKAASRLLRWGMADARVATLMAEEAARAHDPDALLMNLSQVEPFAPEVVRTILHALPREAPPADSKNQYVMGWPYLLSKLTQKAPSCVQHLLHALKQPGFASSIAERTLRGLVGDNPDIRDALRESLERAAKGSNPFELLRLVMLGLPDDATRPSAIAASRALDLRGLSQAQCISLAPWFQSGGADEEAIHLWRQVLDGADLEFVLEAACKLVWDYPEKSREWIQTALVRLLDSPDASFRVDAGRLALACGILEEKAREALLGCLGLSEEENKRQRSIYPDLYVIDQRALGSELTDSELFDPLRFSHQLDFIAMHVLCMYRPDVGLPRLVTWLQAEDWTRFVCGVRFLAVRDDYREAVRSALLTRLTSGPARQLTRVTGLVGEYDLYAPGMEERVLERYDPESRSAQDVEPCLIQWLTACPDLWSTVRRQPEARLAKLAYLIDQTPVTQDVVTFAVGFALAFARYGDADRVVSTLTQWQDSEEQPSHSPELVRGWIREALAEQATPTDIETLIVFDRLAVLGELPTERRIELLRPALAINRPESEDDEHDDRRPLLDLKVDVGLQLLELGCHDERIPLILEEAVHSFATFWAASTYNIANVLLKLRPADAKLRQSLRRAALAPMESLRLESMLDTLAKAGQSDPERIDLLIECLGLGTNPPHWWFKAPELFEALERLGCPPERRSALLLEFLSRYGATLSLEVTLVLAEWGKLSAPTIAKLLVGVIARGGWDAREAAESWFANFASRKAPQRQLELSGLDGSRYLSLQLRSLDRLSQVDDPELLTAVLAELVASPATEELLSLHRRARTGPPLSEEEWEKLMTSLSLDPRDEKVTRLAKEWLTLGLWRKLEPSTLESLLNS